MVGRTKAPQTCPNPENLWVCQLRWWRRIKCLVSWLSGRESSMDYLTGGPNVITRSYFHQVGRACVKRSQSEEFRAQKRKEEPSWCCHMDSCLDPCLKFWASQDFSFTWVKKINSPRLLKPIWIGVFVLRRWNHPLRLWWAINPFSGENHMQTTLRIQFWGSFWPPEVRPQVMKFRSVPNTSRQRGIKEKERRENVFRESRIPPCIPAEELWS